MTRDQFSTASAEIHEARAWLERLNTKLASLGAMTVAFYLVRAQAEVEDAIREMGEKEDTYVKE